MSIIKWQTRSSARHPRRRIASSDEFSTCPTISGCCSPSGERADTAIALTRCCPVGDQLDVDTALLCPDQRLDGARSRGKAVSTDKDLRISAVNRIDGESRAVLLGRKTHRNRHPGSESRDG